METKRIIKGIVSRLQIKQEGVRVDVETLELTPGVGVQKRQNSNKPSADISIIIKKKGHTVSAEEREIGLCIPRFYPNITIEIDEDIRLEAGTILEIDTARIEINSQRKRCFKECKLLQSKKQCYLVDSVYYGKLLD